MSPLEATVINRGLLTLMYIGELMALGTAIWELGSILIQSGWLLMVLVIQLKHREMQQNTSISTAEPFAEM